MDPVNPPRAETGSQELKVKIRYSDHLRQKAARQIVM